MRSRLALILFSLVALSLNGQTLPANVEFVETHGGISHYRLRSNSMPILLMEDHAAPVITFMVVYHVGSRNEAPGNTGSAHLLEHMIFNKSTENFGRAKGHKSFQEVLYEAGADFSSTNMTTWYDRMNGYSTLPSDKLELAMKIEADRLGRGLILDSERQSEMSVVRNEYEIGENNPYNALSTAMIATAIVAHPYHWDTIGYRSDIEGVTTEKLREHYKNFFHANNAQAILVGDFDTASALTLFDRQFGAFKKSGIPIPQVITVEPPQEGERRTLVKRPGNIRIVGLAYMRPGALHPDYIPLEVLSTILGNGISSRLYQAVVEKGLATEVNSYNYTLRDPYPILFEATVDSGSDHAKVEAAMKAVLYEVAAKGVTSDELRRAQEQIEVLVTRGRDGTYPFASNLGEAVASANWKWFVDYVDSINRVTREDVQRVAATYLVPDHATVGWFVPVDPGATKAEPPKAARTGSSSKSPATTREKSKAQSSTVSTPGKASSSFAARTTRKILANGLTVDIVENHAVPTVSIHGIILGGDASAPSGKPAVPMLTASMVQRGTKGRTKQQIADLLESRGATLTLASNLFETTVIGRGMSRDTELMLDILAEELRNPAFKADELLKAKAEIRNEILRNAESTSLRAQSRLTQLVYAESHPYRSPGHEAMTASVGAATAADLKAFHGKNYAGSSIVLAIVGDLDTKKTMALVERLFSSLPKGTRESFDVVRTVAMENPKREVVRMPGKANMNLILGQASGLRRGDPDFEATLLANAALGQNSLSSRIGKRVRDTEGLSYNLNSRYSLTDMLDGIFVVNVNVAPMNLEKALKSTREEIEKYAREGITEDELAVAKSFFSGNYKVGLGSNSGVANALVIAEKFSYGPSYLDEYPGRIARVTREEVNKVIRTRLLPARLHLVVAGDLEKPPEM